MRLAILLLFFTFFLGAAEDNLPGLTVDLREPTLCEGVLTTEQGGVIQAPNVRIQARKLIYTRKEVEGVPICTLYAEGDLILEFGDYYFIGESLEYDFVNKTGIIYNARTAVEPWFFGGERVYLHADSSITLANGFITTSENIDRNWEITTEEANLCEKRYLSAHNIKFRIYQVPLLWLPTYKTDLETIFDSPVRYFFKWGGHQGVRASMLYEVFAWNHFKTLLRVDYRIKRGIGGGIETYYTSEDGKEVFNTINYAAHDNSLSNPGEKIRYRFQGQYTNLVWDDSVSIDLTWDKVSDKDMATDYTDNGLELDIAGRTELLIRRQEINHIDRLISLVKVNPFQSVNQELPTFEVSYRPQSVGETGIIATSLVRASYLDFSYSHKVIDEHSYHSSRVELKQEYYRPFPMDYAVLTPGLEFLGIYYGNSPQHRQRLLGLAHFSAELKTSLTKTFGPCRHVIEPYIKSNYYTAPTVSPKHHYIFGIDDGWFQSNTNRIGILNEFYVKYGSGCLTRPLVVDLFTYGFFDTPTIGQAFPKAYLTVSTLSTPTLRHTIDTAWDFQHGELDHINFRVEWTVAQNLSIRAEYRHRSAWVWRKADIYNFILDAYHSEERLLHSILSDRRDTLLTNLYYQFDPNWALLFEYRHGWNRRHERSYTEFETDLIGRLPSAWNIKLSYQHRQDDDRVAVYFTIGLHKPNQKRCAAYLPCLEL